ncbi:MAG TPA: glycerophosphodiester phosphodiesterase [Planctomycetaceae bacterium]|nr:glycerophosphodiester phosphodiesterase [Planctomycetaceae bacterium]
MALCRVFLFAMIFSGVNTGMAKEPSMVEIVAHRGASHDAPENTLAAIRLGWEQHADAVEFDVYLSKDGQIVLIHDADTERVAGIKRKVVDQTTEELRQLDVGKWKHDQYAGEKIPLLSEALTTIPAGKRVFIEVKCGPEIVPELQRQLAKAKRPVAETAIISFNKEVIAECKKTVPQCKAYWLASIKRDKKTGEWNHTVESLIATAKELHADGLDLSACDLIDRDFGDKVKSSGLELLVWTVNDVKVARQMIAAGVQGITTDRPQWLRQELARAE